MDITTLILTLTGLLGILLVLVLIYVGGSASKQKPGSVSAPAETETPGRAPAGGPRSFDALEAIVLNRKSSKEELRDATEAIAKQYGKIYATTLTRYTRIIVSLCRHPQTDKRIIVDFDRALREQNPNLKTEIDIALKKGLDSRG
jgi:hypothetical protein